MRVLFGNSFSTNVTCSEFGIKPAWARCGIGYGWGRIARRRHQLVPQEGGGLVGWGVKALRGEQGTLGAANQDFDLVKTVTS